MENKLKILLVGSPARHARLASYARSFKDLGHSVVVYDAQSEYRAGLVNRIVNKFLPTQIFWGTGKLNRRIVEVAAGERPDMVLFFKPLYLEPGTLLDIKKRGTKVFCWYADDFFFLAPVNSKGFLRSLKLFDAIFCTKPYTPDELARLKMDNYVFLPHTIDRSCHYPVEVPKDELSQGADVVFVGTYADEERVEYLEKLCSEGYDIKIYGNGWQKLPVNSCLRKKKCYQQKALYCEGMSKILNASKISLGFLRRSNNDTQDARTYEIPACGAFMLHDRSRDTEGIFKEGIEAEYFGSYEEMKRKIDYYLAHPEERRKITEAGYRRAIQPDYSYDDSARRILDAYRKAK